MVDNVRGQRTLDERVSVVSLVTPTHGVVVLDGALGVDTACSWAGVHTLGVDTGQLGGTVVAQQTLRLTSNQRVTCNTSKVQKWTSLTAGLTLVVSDTLTHSLATLDQAVSVTAARVWLTGLRRSRSRRRRSHHLWGTPGERISDCSRRTATDGVVVSDLAESPHPASAGTRVDTLLSDAGESGVAVVVVETLCPAALSRHGVALEA